MKTNKSYIASTLLTQVVLLPLVLTVAIFSVSPIISKLDLKTTLDLDRFILISISSLSSLLLGTLLGLLYAKTSKKKIFSYRGRYYLPIIPIIYCILFAVLATIFSRGNYNSVWWAIYVFKNPTFLVLDFILFFTGYHFLVILIELMGYSGFLLGLVLHDKVSSKHIEKTFSTKSKLVPIGLCISIIATIAFTSKAIIRDGILELRYGKSTLGSELTEYDLFRIAPFKENNGLVTLDKEASLQFHDLETMPRLDGATAAYPVYGAFVQAVYKGLGDYYANNKASNEKDAYVALAEPVETDSYPYNIVKCTKTPDAYERLINKKTDIIFVAEPSKAQLEAIKGKGDEFVLTPVAYEAFVFFTNATNPVEDLSIEEIQGIYSGKIKNWKAVGGKNSSILAYQRPENSGSQTTMQNKVMKDIKMMSPSTESYAGGMGEIIKKVASYKNAKNSIGYSFLYYSSSMINNNQIKYISIDGVNPNPDTIRNKTYPFTVPVYAVTLKSNTNENISKFIDWILSEEGQSMVRNTGYIPAK